MRVFTFRTRHAWTPRGRSALWNGAAGVVLLLVGVLILRYVPKPYSAVPDWVAPAVSVMSLGLVVVMSFVIVSLLAIGVGLVPVVRAVPRPAGVRVQVRMAGFPFRRQYFDSGCGTVRVCERWEPGPWRGIHRTVVEFSQGGRSSRQVTEFWIDAQGFAELAAWCRGHGVDLQVQISDDRPR